MEGVSNMHNVQHLYVPIASRTHKFAGQKERTLFFPSNMEKIVLHKKYVLFFLY